jgi:hypothetical protein
MYHRAVLAISLLPALLAHAQIVRTSRGVEFEYQGCYSDAEQRVLPDRFKQDSGMTNEMCANFCIDYRYFGTEYGTQCFCSQGLSSSASPEAISSCNYGCSGSSSEFCGGFWRIDIYKKRRRRNPPSSE